MKLTEKQREDVERLRRLAHWWKKRSWECYRSVFGDQLDSLVDEFLIDAVLRFDPSLNVRIEAWCYRRIWGALGTRWRYEKRREGLPLQSDSRSFEKTRDHDDDSADFLSNVPRVCDAVNPLETLPGDWESVLTPLQRRIIKAYYLDQKEELEIGERLGMTRQGVNWHKQKALKILREAYAQCA